MTGKLANKVALVTGGRWDRSRLTGSIASIKGFPSFSVYNASKAAVAVVRAQLDRRSQGARNPHQCAEPGHVETPDLSGLMSEKAESGAVALVPLGGSGCQTIWAKPRCSSLPTRALTSPASNSSSLAVWRRFEERGFSGAGSSHRQSGEAKR